MPVLREILTVSFLLLFFPPLALANSQVVINEIMYDFAGSDDNHEWIEVINLGPDSVDLTNWRFEEGGTQHTLTLKQGSLQLAVDGLAVIADNTDQFLVDNHGFAGTLIDSSFSLSNTGENLKLRDSQNGNVVNEITYSSDWGAAGDGNSLQRKTDGSWLTANPTPGQSNATNPAPSPTPAPTPAATPTVQPTSSPVASPAKSPSPAPAKSVTGKILVNNSLSSTGQVILGESSQTALPSTGASSLAAASPSTVTSQNLPSAVKIAASLVGAGAILVGVAMGLFLWYKRTLEKGQKNQPEPESKDGD